LSQVQKSLTVFGATGNTGSKIVELALAQGHRITILVRDKKKLGQLVNRLTVIEGNVLDSDAIGKAIPPGTDAVLSALGHSKNTPKDVETVALRNIVGSMEKNSVKRLVVLANAAISDPKDKPTSSQKLYRLLLRIFERDVYDDSVTKGSVVKNSDLDWTIVRTSLLTNSGPSNEKYRVGYMEKGVGVRISRADMAEFMLKCVFEGKYIRESPYITS
jgi:putative NADH-flavin reductase